MKLGTCVDPRGRFRWGVHQPHFEVLNFREGNGIGPLGTMDDGTVHENHINFPPGKVTESKADTIFEIPNPFPFRGATYICKSWADRKVDNPMDIRLPERPETSLNKCVGEWSAACDNTRFDLNQVINTLPDALRIALASTSTDPDDLVSLAKFCCRFDYEPNGNQPVGLKYRTDNQGRIVPAISDHVLFETLVNNSYLPDIYKEIMVLRPGVQGGSEIVGDWLELDADSHIFEYLRRNSYIPWGHYAANMANDAIRYDPGDLSITDMSGLRHLYYQRTYSRLAGQTGIDLPAERVRMSSEQLESLREKILERLKSPDVGDGLLSFDRTLWGWNFGFDFAPSRYRLHASHQQIHQQFALIPAAASLQPNDTLETGETFSTYGCGDLVASFAADFHTQTGCSFFEAYISAIQTNCRIDGRSDRPSSLIVFEDERVMLFVPKAQTSQWELQLMMKTPVGNILEADLETRCSIDSGILIAARVLSGLGARMITTIEYPKPFTDLDSDQRLLYAFLPKLPESPGAFSEAQLRWINGHYPEDFAAACRKQLETSPVS